MKLVSKNKIEYYVYDGLEDAQSELIRLLSIIDEICKKYKLSYWLEDGSLIGCVRHKGFIPWDDDLDIALLKPDYLKLIELLDCYSKEHSDVRLFYKWKMNYHCCNYFASTKYYGQNGLTISPLKIDIKPFNIIENHADKIKKNHELRSTANELLFHRKAGQVYTQNDLINFFTNYTYNYGIDKLEDNSLLSPPYFDYSLLKPICFTDVFPLKKGMFEGLEVSIPNNYGLLLNNMYGDYEKYPPISKRMPSYEGVFVQNMNNNDFGLIVDMMFQKERVSSFKRLNFVIRKIGLLKIIKHVMSKKI